MQKLNGIKVKYSYAALPPEDIHIGWIYTVLYESSQLNITDGNLVKPISLYILQQQFTPIKDSWDILLKEDNKKQDSNTGKKKNYKKANENNKIELDAELDVQSDIETE